MFSNSARFSIPPHHLDKTNMQSPAPWKLILCPLHPEMFCSCSPPCHGMERKEVRNIGHFQCLVPYGKVYLAILTYMLNVQDSYEDI